MIYFTCFLFINPSFLCPDLAQPVVPIKGFGRNWCALSIWCDAPALGKRTACVMLHNNIWPHLKTWYQLSRILPINNLAGSISLSFSASISHCTLTVERDWLMKHSLGWKWSRQADYGPFLSASLSDSFLNLIFILCRMILYALAHHLLTDWFSSREWWKANEESEIQRQRMWGSGQHFQDVMMFRSYFWGKTRSRPGCHDFWLSVVSTNTSEMS